MYDELIKLLKEKSTPQNFQAIQELITNSKLIPCTVAVEPYKGWTALHIAAAQGRRDVVAFLCKKTDCDPKQTITDGNAKGCTALHLAAAYGHRDVVAFLCQETDCNPKQTITDGNAKGWIPLHLAAENGKLDVAKFLARFGVSVTFFKKYALEPAVKNTPFLWQALSLFESIEYNEYKAALTILTIGDCAVNLIQDDNTSLLHLLVSYFLSSTDIQVRNDIITLVEALIKKGVDRCTKNNMDLYPYQLIKNPDESEQHKILSAHLVSNLQQSFDMFIGIPDFQALLIKLLSGIYAFRDFTVMYQGKEQTIPGHFIASILKHELGTLLSLNEQDPKPLIQDAISWIESILHCKQISDLLSMRTYRLSDAEYNNSLALVLNLQTIIRIGMSSLTASLWESLSSQDRAKQSVMTIHHGTIPQLDNYIDQKQKDDSRKTKLPTTTLSDALAASSSGTSPQSKKRPPPEDFDENEDNKRPKIDGKKVNSFQSPVKLRIGTNQIPKNIEADLKKELSATALMDVDMDMDVVIATPSSMSRG